MYIYICIYVYMYEEPRLCKPIAFECGAGTWRHSELHYPLHLPLPPPPPPHLPLHRLRLLATRRLPQLTLRIPSNAVAEKGNVTAKPILARAALAPAALQIKGWHESTLRMNFQDLAKGDKPRRKESIVLTQKGSQGLSVKG